VSITDIKLSDRTESTGNQILEALGNLNRVLQQPQETHHPPDFYPSPSNDSLELSSGAPNIQHHYHHYYYHDKTNSPKSSNEDKQDTPIGLSHSPGGLDSVLKWNVFPQPIPFSDLCTTAGPNFLHSHALPSAELAEMERLEGKYVAYVHIKNPILDLTKTHHLILRTAENGLDWSTDTCLVALICALGAISRPYSVDRKFRDDDALSDGDEKIAYQYWSVAAKRLGLVIGQNDLVTVQCLCLAGSVPILNC